MLTLKGFMIIERVDQAIDIESFEFSPMKKYQRKRHTFMQKNKRTYFQGNTQTDS